MIDINFDEYIFPKGKINFSDAKFGDTDVSFSSTDFGNSNVNFSGATFGDGDISLNGATFGNGNVTRVNFGKGSVNFQNATFGKGHVNFQDAEFDDGNVNFSGATFGNGGVYFNDVYFGNGNVDFTRVNLGKGSVNFQNATFGKGHVNFQDAEFGDGDVNFIHARFGDGGVNFSGVNFGDGHISLNGATFGDGNVHFLDATFGCGEVTFSDINFGKGKVDFKKSSFEGHVDFSKLVNAKTIKQFSLKQVTFNKSVDISFNELNCIVDFTNTAINHQLTLDNLTCNYEKKNIKKYGLTWEIAANPDDISRLRRLKEIAEDNKDHELALEFNAQEMRAKRWHGKNQLSYVILDCAYEKLSDYGRSILRPIFSLITSWFFFSCLYFLISSHVKPLTCEKFYDAMAFSGGQILPFAPSSRLTIQQGVQSLFANDLSFLIYVITILQSTVSFGLLFLIGLALRNRFRI